MLQANVEPEFHSAKAARNTFAPERQTRGKLLAIMRYNVALYTFCILLSASRIMPASSDNDIEKALSGIAVPFLGIDLLAAGASCVESAAGGKLMVTLKLGFYLGEAQAGVEAGLASAIAAATGREAEVSIISKVAGHAVQGTLSPLPNVKNVIAVASGKGGVGKSTVAANLAMALHADGAKVGVLDADIYGPSQARMLGSSGQQPISKDGKKFEPLQCHGLSMISAGNLFAEEDPAVWRGPMVTQALTQLTFQTNWPELDYLIVDMPPGTGDIQLTLSQKIPVAGAVIVTTPQDIALLDARKGYKMFEKVNVPVLGVVENMSTFICPHCHKETPLFGQGGGADMAADYGLPLLGQIPLNASIRLEADNGKPSVLADPEGPAAAEFRKIARNMAAALSVRKKDYKKAFPKIVVE
jgi:ATP-binding protein involved in chromosome partitioning